jgi:transglutaminase-like putative cysteine protease
MLYDLDLRITYDYEATAGTSRHLLRVVPRELPGVQHVLSHRLTVDPPPAESSVFTDAFGNVTQDVLLRDRHDSLDIHVHCRVGRTAPEPSAAAGTPLDALGAEIGAVRSLDADAPHHYLGASTLVRPRRRTTEFARDALRQGLAGATVGASGEAGATVVGSRGEGRALVDSRGEERARVDSCGAALAVRRVGLALYHAMTFDSKATEVDTPFEHAFDARRGVCQDFTHIMIACLRGLGIPAGYVSGFIRTKPPPGQERLAGADAMHAWVRAWCGAQAGWLQYDPTNAIEVGDDHIVVALGRDYFDVSPAKGVLRTAGSHTGRQAVDLVEAQAS